MVEKIFQPWFHVTQARAWPYGHDQGFYKEGIRGGWLGGFLPNGGIPIAGLFIIDNPTKMDENWGYPYLGKPPYHDQQSPVGALRHWILAGL